MMKKIAGFTGMSALTLVFTLVVFGCASVSTINWSDLPQESAEPSPFEGTWAGTEKTGTGPIQTVYQFKGNTFLKRTIRPNPGTAGGWWKGIFTYADNEITLYSRQGYEANGVRDPRTGTVSYKWTDFSEYLKKASGEIKTYTFDSDTLAFGESQFKRRSIPEPLPEECVFFQNDNNVLANNSGPNPYAFSITAVDDQKASYVNMAFLGEGYAPIEIAEPGPHKISFQQKYRYTESGSSRRMESDVEGYFTRNFEPGIYSFSLYTPEHNAYMPSNLPPVPDGSTRVVIIKREIGEFAELYGYIDISTTNAYR
jgi:hypothetical protein